MITPPPPASKRSTSGKLTPALAVGTIVQMEGKPDVFRISSPAGWGGPDNATPACYHLVAADGKIVPSVPAGKLSVAPPALREAMQQPGSPASWTGFLLRRMLNNPEATRRMGKRVLGKRAEECGDLRRVAGMLLPHYFQTHCWQCRGFLDNLSHEICPKCRGIECACGACRCNWPFGSITSFQNFKS